MLLSAFRIASEPGALKTINRTWDRDETWGQSPLRTKQRELAEQVDRFEELERNGQLTDVTRNFMEKAQRETLGGLTLQEATAYLSASA